MSQTGSPNKTVSQGGYSITPSSGDVADVLAGSTYDDSSFINTAINEIGVTRTAIVKISSLQPAASGNVTLTARVSVSGTDGIEGEMAVYEGDTQIGSTVIEPSLLGLQNRTLAVDAGSVVNWNNVQVRLTTKTPDDDELEPEGSSKWTWVDIAAPDPVGIQGSPIPVSKPWIGANPPVEPSCDTGSCCSSDCDSDGFDYRTGQQACEPEGEDEGQSDHVCADEPCNTCGEDDSPVPEHLRPYRLLPAFPPELEAAHNVLKSGLRTVDSASGNLRTTIRTPTSGAHAPTAVFRHNSRAVAASPFGRGWSGAFTDHLEDISGGAGDKYLVSSRGRAFRFTNFNATTQKYASPGNSTLQLMAVTGGHIAKRQDGTEYRFDSSGKLTYIRDAVNNRWSTTYDVGGKLEHVKDPAGKRLTYAYDANNKIRRIEDVAGRITTFTIDINGDLTQSITPELCTTNYRYDGTGRIATLIRPEGNRTSYSYDSQGRMETAQLSTGARVTYNYGSGSTAVTDPNGGRTTQIFDDEAQLTCQINALGYRTSFAWDAGRLKRIEAPNNAITTMLSRTDDAGVQQLSAIINAQNSRYTFAYDSSDRVGAVADWMGTRTTFSWNSTGQRMAIADADGNRTSFSYNANGRVAGVTNPLGNRTSYAYDTNASLTAVENALAYRTSFHYDDMGQAVATQNPLNQRNSCTFDDMNRLVAKKQPLGNPHTMTYDANGRVTVAWLPQKLIRLAIERPLPTTPAEIGLPSGMLKMPRPRKCWTR